MTTPTIRNILRDAAVKLACMKAALYDDLIASLEQIADQPTGPQPAPTTLTEPPPAFSPESLRAMEALAAGEALPVAHDPLDTATITQPTPATTTDPLDAPRPRRGGRRSRGPEGSPQPEPQAATAPEPQPDDLDLPGEPLTEAEPAPETGSAPAPEAPPSTDPVDALFGTPGDDFDPLA